MFKKYLTIAGISLFCFGCTVSKPVGLPEAPGTTSNAVNLTRETNDPAVETYPRVSPDGKYLLYQKLEGSSSLSQNQDGSLGYSNNRRTTIMKKEIGMPTVNPLVVDAAEPAWLSDGSGLVFSYVKPAQPVIVKTSVQGVGLNYISQGAMGTSDSEPNITKDGSKIIFTTKIGANQMICSMDSKGGGFTVITEGSHVSIFPGEDKIIYNQKVDKFTQIFVLDLKTGQKSQLTNGEYNNRDGAFSTDGKWIGFVSNREKPASRSYNVYVMRADGTELKQLTTGDTTQGDPCWSPDNTVYFFSNAGGKYNIWKVKPIL